MSEFPSLRLLVLTVTSTGLLISLWMSYVNCLPTHSMRDDFPRKGLINQRKIQNGRRTILRKRMSWLEGDIECFEILGSNLAILESTNDAKELSQAIHDISAWNGTKPDYHLALNKYEWGLERRYWIGLSDNWGNHSEYFWKIPDVPKVNKSLPFKFPVDSGKGQAPPPPADNPFTANQPDHNNKTIERKLGPKHLWEHCVGFWNPNYFRGDLHTLNDMPCHYEYYPICDSKPYEK